VNIFFGEHNTVVNPSRYAPYAQDHCPVGKFSSYRAITCSQMLLNNVLIWSFIKNDLYYPRRRPYGRNYHDGGSWVEVSWCGGQLQPRE